MKPAVNFLRSIFRTADGDPDEIVIIGCICLVVMCALCTYNVVGWHGPFDPFNFGGGCAAVIAAMAGGKPLRDRWMRPPPPAGHPMPGMPTQP